MVGFDHGPQRPRETEAEPAGRGSRYGRVLFAFYVLLYGGFVLITAFAPAVMRQTPVAGINLSVLYGLALIAAAFLLAVLYDWLCRPTQDQAHEDAHGDRE